MDKNSIKDIILAVTYKCNSRCRFCNIWQNKEDFSCQSINYKKLPHNLETVNISGGEPFLRDDLLEIVKIISRQSPKAKITISTNGFLPSKIKETMQRITKFKKNIGLAVSLDGFGKVHEELRRFPGGYCLVIETIRLLKELGIRDLKIAFTLGDDNVNQLKRIYRLSRELGVEFSLALYHNSSHYFQKENNRIVNIRKIKRELNWLIEQELKGFFPKRWLRAYFAWGLIRFLETDQRVLPDYSGLDSLFIDPFGKIYPSNTWGLEIGRLERINDWERFSQRTRPALLVNQSPANWMLCTARQAMKKHWFQVVVWILREKLCLKTKGNQHQKQLSLFLKRISSLF
ncbi:MAG: radical SAM protein [Patescibacteria group bacterium]